MTSTLGNVVALQSNGFATIPDAARFLAVSRSTIYKLMYGGDLHSKKIGRSRRIPWASLRSYAEQDWVAELQYGGNATSPSH